MFIFPTWYDWTDSRGGDLVMEPMRHRWNNPSWFWKRRPQTGFICWTTSIVNYSILYIYSGQTGHIKAVLIAQSSGWFWASICPSPQMIGYEVGVLKSCWQRFRLDLSHCSRLFLFLSAPEFRPRLLSTTAKREKGGKMDRVVQINLNLNQKRVLLPCKWTFLGNWLIWCVHKNH